MGTMFIIASKYMRSHYLFLCPYIIIKKWLKVDYYIWSDIHNTDVDLVVQLHTTNKVIIRIMLLV